MNKVKFFSAKGGYTLENEINVFAEKHEIINISYVYDSHTYAIYPERALVLYKN